jgi:hypothetical protein
MGHVTTGKRAGPGRHAGPARLEAPPAPKRRSSAVPLFFLALGITGSMVAWGYLVYLAIDFGTAARDGETRAWAFLALATVGGIACLFLALTLGTRFAIRLRESKPPPAPPQPPCGRRAAR